MNHFDHPKLKFQQCILVIRPINHDYALTQWYFVLKPHTNTSDDPMIDDFLVYSNQTNCDCETFLRCSVTEICLKKKQNQFVVVIRSVIDGFDAYTVLRSRFHREGHHSIHICSTPTAKIQNQTIHFQSNRFILYSLRIDSVCLNTHTNLCINSHINYSN